jgi:hypothetical protein
VIVYISIGNSDDKLTQSEWSKYVSDLLSIVEFAGDRTEGGEIHGIWHSAPFSPFQNMVVCLQPAPDYVSNLRRLLAELARKYRQDSIAWAEATTTFIRPEGQQP